MAVDISPVVNSLLQLAGVVVLSAGTWAITKVVTWLNLKNSAQATASLDDALQKAVTYGLQQTQDAIKQKGWDHIDVRNAALAQAAPYMISRFPDVLKDVGLDMSDQAGLQTAVTGALDRAFPHAVAVSAASPATPPPTAPSPPTTAGLANQPNVTTTLVETAKA